MAITIVGQDTKHVKQCSCRNCAAILEYTMADTQTRKDTDYTGGSDIVRFVQCPRCGYQIPIS